MSTVPRFLSEGAVLELQSRRHSGVTAPECCSLRGLLPAIPGAFCLRTIYACSLLKYRPAEDLRRFFLAVPRQGSEQECPSGVSGCPQKRRVGRPRPEPRLPAKVGCCGKS